MRYIAGVGDCTALLVEAHPTSNHLFILFDHSSVK